MADKVVWTQRPDRHYRRYTRPDRFPFIVEWGNTRLTMPSMRRTFVGALVTAMAWRFIRRPGVFVTYRGDTHAGGEGA